MYGTQVWRRSRSTEHGACTCDEDSVSCVKVALKSNREPYLVTLTLTLALTLTLTLTKPLTLTLTLTLTQPQVTCNSSDASGESSIDPIFDDEDATFDDAARSGRRIV